MTIFRSDQIGMEVVLDGDTRIDVSMDRQGRASVAFAEGGCMAMGQLRVVLDRCEAELLALREQLRAPGGIWAA